MWFLRGILIVFLVYYLLKFLGRAFFSSRSRPGRQERKPEAGGGKAYSKLTDQEIEDADFEEIDSEDTR